MQRDAITVQSAFRHFPDALLQKVEILGQNRLKIFQAAVPSAPGCDTNASMNLLSVDIDNPFLEDLDELRKGDQGVSNWVIVTRSCSLEKLVPGNWWAKW